MKLEEVRSFWYTVQNTEATSPVLYIVSDSGRATWVPVRHLQYLFDDYILVVHTNKGREYQGPFNTLQIAREAPHYQLPFFSPSSLAEIYLYCHS